MGLPGFLVVLGQMLKLVQNGLKPGKYEKYKKLHKLLRYIEKAREIWKIDLVANMFALLLHVPQYLSLKNAYDNF